MPSVKRRASCLTASAKARAEPYGTVRGRVGVADSSRFRPT